MLYDKKGIFILLSHSARLLSCKHQLGFLTVPPPKWQAGIKTVPPCREGGGGILLGIPLYNKRHIVPYPLHAKNHLWMCTQKMAMHAKKYTNWCVAMYSSPLFVQIVYFSEVMQ
jgi:hypothetical protein